VPDRRPKWKARRRAPGRWPSCADKSPGSRFIRLGAIAFGGHLTHAVLDVLEHLAIAESLSDEGPIIADGRFCSVAYIGPCRCRCRQWHMANSTHTCFLRVACDSTVGLNGLPCRLLAGTRPGSARR